MTSQLQKIVALKKVPRFRAIRFEELSVLAEAAEVFRIQQNCRLSPDVIWVIVAGSFRKEGAAAVGPGELLTSDRATEVWVEEAGEVLAFTPERIQRLLREQPELAVSLVEEFGLDS